MSWVFYIKAQWCCILTADRCCRLQQIQSFVNVHIDGDCHFIRERIEDKRIKLKYLHINEQLADFLTKVVPRKKLSNSLPKQICIHQLEGECYKLNLSVILGNKNCFVNMEI